MQLSSGLFSTTALWWIAALYGLILLTAVRLAPWRRVFLSGLSHIFMGSCVALILLWSVKAPVNASLTFHLLGMTAMTLVFGWSLAIIGSGVALLGVIINTGTGWDVFPLNAMILGVVPITLTQISLILGRSLLPKNFFVYVLVNGFLTAGVAALVSGFLTVALLIMSGQFSLFQLKETFIPFLPLMIMPEAFLNGWIMTVLVVYRPHWVYSFSDVQYIKGK